MDLQALFQDSRVIKKTHIVMKSTGVKSKQFAGWQVQPKKDKDGNPVHEIVPVKERENMELLGWVKVEQVKEPSEAISKPKKAVKDVE